MNIHTFTDAVNWTEAHPWATGTTAGLLLAALATAGWGLKRAVARYGGANVLTGFGAVLANSLSAVGMWRTLEHGMNLNKFVLVVVFPLFEVAVFASALRAGAAIKAAAKDKEASGENGHVSGGVDGVAVWVLTCVSAALSAMDASHPLDVCIRIAAPMVAAWLWERSLAPARRAARGDIGPGILTTYLTRIRTNLLSWAGEESADEIARRRAAARASRLSDKLRHAKSRTGRRGRWISRRLRKAVRTSGAAHSAADRRYLLEDIAASRNADALADLKPASPWSLGEAPTTAEAAFTRHARESMEIAETRIRAELPKAYPHTEKPYPQLLFADVTPITDADSESAETASAQTMETPGPESAEAARPHPEDTHPDTAPAHPAETPAEAIPAFSPSGQGTPETAQTAEAKTPRPAQIETPRDDEDEQPPQDGETVLPQRYLDRLADAHAYIDAAEAKAETPSANGLRVALNISRNWCGPLFRHAMEQRANTASSRPLRAVETTVATGSESSDEVTEGGPAPANGLPPLPPGYQTAAR